jgi:CubicO group peptidase (beta-lactamase class C family)
MSVAVAALIAVVQACVSPSADPIDTLTDAERLAELERVIPMALDSGGVTGLSVAVVSDSGVVWSRGFGVRNVATGEPVDTQSVFEAASLSKPVFAYAVLQLVDQGLIDLDTPLATYYEYADIAHDARHRSITARMVLTHSTGFPNWRRDGELTINFEPGSEFSYSGEGFGYLQRAVMHLTGEPLQELMERLVFEPLEMTNSGYIWDERFDAHIAMPHDEEGQVAEKRKPRRGQGHAAATLHTTAPDFGRFLVAVLNGTGLSDSLAGAMLSPQIAVDSGVTWGLGIGLQDNEAGRALWHWGDNQNYKAYTVASRDHAVGVVWFTNSQNGQAVLSSLLAHTVGGDQPAVRWLDYEQYDSPVRFVREELQRLLDEDDAATAIARYRELKTTRPPEAFNEFLLNTLGYRLLRAERVDEAIQIFTLNVEEYPDAFNPYDSLGEAYMVAGELELAIEYYERSIELNPDNTNGKAMLERIRGEM